MLVAISVLTANSGSMIYALEETRAEDTSVKQEVTEEAAEEATQESEAIVIDSGKFSDNLTWIVDDSGTMMIEGSGKLSELYLIDGSALNCVKRIVLGADVEVTDIDTGVFWNCRMLEAIEVSGENEHYASADGILFNKDMTELIAYPMNKNDESYTIPESVVKIADGAFANCMFIKELYVPGNVSEIGAGAFMSCSALETVELSEGLKNIGAGMFSFCEELGSVNIPASVEEIGHCAFGNCLSLTEINVNTENKFYKSVDGILFNKDMTELIAYPIFKNNESYIIPESVVRIADGAFEDCTFIEEVYITGNVSEVGFDAFRNCSALETVEFSEGLKEIKSGMFGYCNNLESVNIPASVEEIDESAFSACSSLTEINVNTENKFYKSVDGVLYNKDMTELIKYPDGRKVMEYSIPYGVVKIRDGACKSAQFLSVIIPDSVKIIGESAFDYSAILSVSIGKNVEEIAYSAFRSCYYLTGVYYSGSEEEWNDIDIDYEAFSSWNKRNSFYFNEEKAADVIASGECGKEKGDIVWTFYKNGLLKIEGNGEMDIDEDCPWVNCVDYIREVFIADGVTTIGDYAFRNCTHLTTVTIPESVTVIGIDAFGNCESLEKITLPYSVIPPGLLFNSTDKVHLNDSDIMYVPDVIGGEEEKVSYGDLNEDGVVDLVDLTCLSLYLLGDVTLDENTAGNGDVNGNGVVDLSDLAHFKQYISKDNVTIGKQ